MIIAALIFTSVLFVVGVWCILLVRGSFKKDREDEERSRETQAWPRLQPEPTRQQALIRARAAARRRAERERADRWKNLTPSSVSQAFKDFLRDETTSSFDASLVSAAFEKFMKEMKVRR